MEDRASIRRSSGDVSLGFLSSRCLVVRKISKIWVADLRVRCVQWPSSKDGTQFNFGIGRHIGTIGAMRFLETSWKEIHGSLELEKTYVLCFEPLRNISKYMKILVVIDTLKPVLISQLSICIWHPKCKVCCWWFCLTWWHDPLDLSWLYEIWQLPVVTYVKRSWVPSNYEHTPQVLILWPNWKTRYPSQTNSRFHQSS